MQRLYDGVVRFHKKSGRKAWKELAKGQSPHMLFITCADSRIVPGQILQCEPGEVFVTRNIGNLVEAGSDRRNSVAAVVEYAVEALGVDSIVLCGHTDCGAMKALLHPESLAALPAVARWMKGAEKAVDRARRKYPELTGKRLLTRIAEENVLLQIAQLRTHPAVKSREAAGQLDLFAWMFHIESGTVKAFDAAAGEFVTVGDGGVPPLPPPAALGGSRTRKP
jgi:carbonic anhydrase